MTIDEAIKWYKDKEDEYRYLSKEHKDFDIMVEQYHQFIEWLTDYKELKNSIGAVKLSNMKEALELIREYKAENIAQKKMIAEYKRLLKAAVEDIHELLCDKKNLNGNGQSCNICSYIEWCPCCKECTIREDLRNWRYADKALKLIEG